jgi:hypothetical protein
MTQSIVGNNGLVKIDVNAVANVLNWSISTTANIVPNTVLGDPWETNLVGTKTWSGAISCYWVDDDTTGQDLLVEGALVDVELYPDTDAPGSAFYSGSIRVGGVEYGGVENNTTATANFSFTGNGAMTREAVPV